MFTTRNICLEFFYDLVKKNLIGEKLGQGFFCFLRLLGDDSELLVKQEAGLLRSLIRKTCTVALN